MNDNLTFSSAKELNEHYRAARARVWAGKPVLKPPEPEPVPEPVSEPVPELSPIDMQAAHAILDAAPWEAKYVPIMREVCARHGVTVVDLRGKCRKAALALARHELAYRLRNETSYSFQQIGNVMGGRDHTSVIGSIRRYKLLMDAGKFDPIKGRGNL